MLKDQDKYQNLVSQIHDLNRQNLLNENENIEQLTNKIDRLEEKLNKIDELKIEIKKLPKDDYKEEKENKLQYYILGFLILNSMILFYLLYSITFLNNQDIKTSEKTFNQKEIRKVEIEQRDDILSLKKEILADKVEEYEQIVPLIRKGTIYTCKDDINTYEIPYTIEIKGKLYADRFLFILQKNSITKDCTIKKEHM